MCQKTIFQWIKTPTYQVFWFLHLWVHVDRSESYSSESMWISSSRGSVPQPNPPMSNNTVPIKANGIDLYITAYPKNGKPDARTIGKYEGLGKAICSLGFRPSSSNSRSI